MHTQIFTVVIAGTMALGGGGFVFALICVLPTPVWQVRLMDVSSLHLELGWVQGCNPSNNLHHKPTKY
jgi:hypothetical protein